MKAVILGGGIAGLTAGILFQRNNWTVVVNEKSKHLDPQGFAFLMSSDGLSVLNKFINSTGLQLNRQNVALFSLKTTNNQEIIKIKLKGWSSMKRKDLVSFLHSFFTENTLKYSRVFSHFIYENEKAVAAVFENGEIEYGDIFIGADGVHSKVREQVFGSVHHSPVEVKEIVGICKFEWEDDNKGAVFQKFQSNKHGLSFGIIPVALNEVVWFMQYDARLETSVDKKDVESLKTFCLNMLQDFPLDVKNVLQNNDFTKTYLWNTTDFDLLPSFNKNNIVLIGDAAHLALPFTSAGSTNAILDAEALIEGFEKYTDYNDAFEYYYLQRSSKLKHHIEQGRELKNTFLNPTNSNQYNYKLPLVSDDDKAISTIQNKPINILYFTDPICSTCWIIQPILRKLQLEYEDYINIDYKMGGLLPSWKEFSKGIIKQPLDAANHWEDVSLSHKTPIIGDVWIEDQLESSYPPSIAFKAAQLQSVDKAIILLRRLKELVFIQKKNITKWEIIESVALKVGLDTAQLMEDMQNKGKDLFLEDLKLSKEYDVNLFPSIYFSNESGTKLSLKGYHPYEKFEKIIKEIAPDIIKKRIDIDPEELFIKFNNMTESEFLFLSNMESEKGSLVLQKLYEDGKIEKLENRNGLMWMYKNSD
ncbi:MAG: DsbA family protein [Bacteroidota bacterium]